MRKKLINFPLTLGNYKNFFFFIMKGTCQNYFLRDYWILLLFFYAITLRCIYLVVMYGRHIYKRGLSVGIFNCMKLHLKCQTFVTRGDRISPVFLIHNPTQRTHTEKSFKSIENLYTFLFFVIYCR